MNIALIGLGRMGANIARRLHKDDHQIVAFNRSSEKTLQLEKEIGVQAAFSLKETVVLLTPPRTVWLMLPAGDVTENTIIELQGLLKKDDVIIDGANSYYKDSIRRGKFLKESGIHFLDVGVSGGIWGLTEGYSLMIGGDKEVVDRLKPIIISLAPGKDKGWGRVGPIGAGHFSKMIHNGIEYGMMEALAEGFELLTSKQEFNIDLAHLAGIWQYGSVIRSWLLDLVKDIFDENANLDQIAAWAEDSGEGRWAVQESIEQAVPTPVITESLFRRFASRQDNSMAIRLISAIRNKFGGHPIKTS